MPASMKFTTFCKVRIPVPYVDAEELLSKKSMEDIVELMEHRFTLEEWSKHLAMMERARNLRDQAFLIIHTMKDGETLLDLEANYGVEVHIFISP